jgi:transcriptional regulator with XRE-family HTH domain
MTPTRERQRFAAALRQHMKVWGLSQEALAERLGTAQSAVSTWVNGKSIPNHERLFALERVFEVAPGTLASLVNRVPTDVEHRCEVVTAVEENEILSRAHKDVLLTLYQSLLELDAGLLQRRSG